MKTNYSTLAFALITILFAIYIVFFISAHHELVWISGWDTQLINTKVLMFGLVGLGGLWSFAYFYSSDYLYSTSMSYLHVFLFLLLIIIVVRWHDYNEFFLSVFERGEFSTKDSLLHHNAEVEEKDRIYRIAFWSLIVSQLIYFLNLILGLFAKKSAESSMD